MSPRVLNSFTYDTFMIEVSDFIFYARYIEFSYILVFISNMFLPRD